MKKILKLLPIILALTIWINPVFAYATEEVEEEIDMEASSEGSSETNVFGETETEGDEDEDVPTSNVSDVDGARNGVVQVNYVYIDDNEDVHIIKGGTGFLIGYEDKTEYVITCASNITLGKDEKANAYKYLGIKKKKDGEYENAKFEVQVVAESDVTVDATILTTSSELDLTVIKLSQPIHTRTPLAIYTSLDGKTGDLPYAVADKVYALGLPDAVIYKDNEKYYSNDRVAMSTGDIVNLTSINDIQRIQHDAEVGTNNCGGPLVNADGNVIGMNNLEKDGTYSCAIDSTVLIKVLDALGLEYIKLTKDDLAATEEASTAISVEPVTPPTVQTEKKISILLIIPIILCVVLFIVVIAYIVKTTLDKKKLNDNQPKAKKEKETEKEQVRSFASGKMAHAPEKKSSSGSMGTSVLGANGGDGTTVLGSGEMNKANIISGSLIRKSNKKNELISKSPFIIGKDALHVDFCINDNGAISRMHAKIISKVDGVYIDDCNSTNGTVVNGKRVIEGNPVKLSDGDTIVLADEEFEYRI